MIPRTRTRETLIALLAPVGSVAAALIAYSLLVVGPSQRSRRVIESAVPPVLGADAVTVAALIPTAFVITAISSAILVEVATQFTAAQTRRRELEAKFFGERD